MCLNVFKIVISDQKLPDEYVKQYFILEYLLNVNVTDNMSKFLHCWDNEYLR